MVSDQQSMKDVWLNPSWAVAGRFLYDFRGQHAVERMRTDPVQINLWRHHMELGQLSDSLGKTPRRVLNSSHWLSRHPSWHCGFCATCSSETYWILCFGILAMLFNSWTTAVCRHFYRKTLMFVTTVQIDKMDCTKMNADFTACPWEGLIHEWTHIMLAPPLPLTPVSNSRFCFTHGACTQKASGRWGALVSVACAG